ncbi:MAG: alpha/beta hydrolase-fold protein, partial [Phycisphaeraceae bacterium]
MLVSLTMIPTATVLALLMVTLQAHAANPADLAELYEAHTYQAADGGEMPYRLLMPENYDPQKQYPLVVLLHGAGERGSDNQSPLQWGAAQFTDPANRQAYPAFVVVPQCPQSRAWSVDEFGELRRPRFGEPAEMMTRVLGLIAELDEDYAIDPARRYAMGLSMGGYGVWDIITREPGLFAAAVPICGGGDADAAPNAREVPIWAFHSSDDPVVPVATTRSMVQAVRAAGGEVTYTEYADRGHNAWSPAFDNAGLLPGLFDQRRT